MIQSLVDVVGVVLVVDIFVLLATNLVPSNFSPHGRKKNFVGFDLVGKRKAEWVFCKCWWLLGDVT